MALPYPSPMFGGHDPFDLIAGLEEPTLDTAEPTDPLYHEPGRGAGFLEALGQTYRPVQANDFGTAFANSLLGGLAAKGRTVAEKRAQHEARLETRRSARDKANISATEDYLKRRADSKARFASEARTDQRADAKDRTTYERDFVQVPADAPAWVRRLTDKEGRVPRSVLADALKPEKTSGTADDAAFGLSDAAKKLAARQYLQSGQMPAMGMGKQAAKDRRDILNVAAQMNPEGAIAANRAALAANTSALTGLQKQMDNMGSQEETANANAAVLEATLPKIPETGTTIGNWLARKGATLLGSDAMAAFHSSIETVRPEFARILNGTSGGNTALSDSQKKDLSAVIAGDYTRNQIKSAIGILRKDVVNRRHALQGRIDLVQQRIADGGTLQAPGSAEGRVAPAAAPADSTGRPQLSGGWR